MGHDRSKNATPDLFSTDGIRADVPSPPKQGATNEAAATAPQRHILPKNLPHAIRQLIDEELDDLFKVTLDEVKRRGRLPPGVRTGLTPSAPRPIELATKRLATDKRPRAEIAEVPLARGQVNAVRAAFKAGITPSRIARQFGISHSNVRKALANDPSK